MWLPRFSLRTTLYLITASALFFVIAAQAVRGRAWAVGVTVGVASVFAALATYLIVYAMCAIFSRLVGVEVIVAKTSRGALLRDVGAGPTPVVPTTAAPVEEAD